MARFRIIFLSISVVGLLLIAGILWAGLKNDGGEDLFRSLGILTEVVHLVENNYVDELNPETLASSLDAGLVEGVDVWASVVPADEAKEFRLMQASAPAYGLLLSSRLGSAAIRSTMKASPAELAGLKPWEVIEKLDGVYTRGRPLRQIRLELSRKFREGSTVHLRVVDRLVDEKRDVELAATPWKIDAFDFDDRDGVSILKIHSLQKGTVRKILDEQTGDGPLIVDLRDVIWGDEGEAAAFIDLFTDEGILAQWKGRRAGEKSYDATSFLRFHEAPVVIISLETEDIGEIVADGLRRAGATLIGEKSIGHAPHMEYVDGGDFELYMPVGQWLRADGEKINRNGIEPDEKIGRPEEGVEGDPVLDRALEIAVGMKEKEAQAA